MPTTTASDQMSSSNLSLSNSKEKIGLSTSAKAISTKEIEFLVEFDTLRSFLCSNLKDDKKLKYRFFYLSDSPTQTIVPYPGINENFNMLGDKFRDSTSENIVNIVLLSLNKDSDSLVYTLAREFKRLYHPFSTKDVRNKGIQDKDQKAVHYYPTLFLSTSYQIKAKPEEQKNHLNNNFDYLDSSIWCRIIDIGEDKAIEKIEEYLSFVSKNYDLFKLSCTNEYIELCSRLVINNFLSGSHNTVMPFRFHSEIYFKSKAEEDSKKFSGEYSKLKWRLLLVDDKGESGLSEWGDLDKISNLTKGEVLKRIIAELGLQDVLEMEYVNSVGNAEKKLNKEHNLVFDLILLDYNLDGHYGTELLHELDDKQKLDDKQTEYNKGPLDYFWILPITAFNGAFQEDMRNKALPHFNKNWFISDGADPVNTPELFKFKLIEILEQIVERSFNPDLKGIFCKIPKNDDKNKEFFKENFSKCVRIYSKFEQLKKAQNSLFCQSFIAKNKNFEEYFPHLVNLFYFLSFCNKLQASQMWEELNAFYREIKKTNLGEIGLKDKDSELEEFFNNYRRYISKLAND